MDWVYIQETGIMILLFADGKVQTFDTNVDVPRFRLPALAPQEAKWSEHHELMYFNEPEFTYLDFRYITTVDDHRVYKEFA